HGCPRSSSCTHCGALYSQSCKVRGASRGFGEGGIPTSAGAMASISPAPHDARRPRLRPHQRRESHPGGDVKRGESWWANLDLAIGDELWEDKRRPVVLLSRGDEPEFRAMVIVTPAKADIRGAARPHPGRILCDWLV